MLRSPATESREVLVTEPGQRQELLNKAETELQQIAMVERCAGILATRHTPGRYTFELSTTVPYGETWEQTLS